MLARKRKNASEVLHFRSSELLFFYGSLEEKKNSSIEEQYCSRMEV